MRQRIFASDGVTPARGCRVYPHALDYPGINRSGLAKEPRETDQDGWLLLDPASFELRLPRRP